MLLVLILLLVEGAEEDKMETDTDGQQPEKVKSMCLNSPTTEKTQREHAFHSITVEFILIFDPFQGTTNDSVSHWTLLV